MKAFKAGGPDQDVSNIYLCPFCKGTGTLNCFSCRGVAKHWPAQMNIEVRALPRHSRFDGCYRLSQSHTRIPS